MEANGQIIFPPPKKDSSTSRTPGRSINHAHSPPIESETGNYLKSVLSFLIDDVVAVPKNPEKVDVLTKKEAVKTAQQEIVKEDIKKKEQNIEKLDDLIEKSNKNLMTLSTVFPFKLFPTIITIDPDKVTVTFKEFFNSNNFQTILIKEITNIEVQTDLFFGSLKIIDSVMRGHVIFIKYLKKKEAEKARKIIQGLIVGTKQQVDFSQIEPEELKEKVEELGESPAS